MYVLGISSYYHDSAAALLRAGEIVAAVQEERFSRKKGDAQFPTAAIRYCLKAGGITLDEVEAVVFYDKPWLKFERILQTAAESAPFGLVSFLASMPVWMDGKFNLRRTLARELNSLGAGRVSRPIYFSSHHLSHAASAYYPSPFEEAAVLCVDGVGEFATTSAWRAKGTQLTPLWEIHYPHSLGLLYAAFTVFCGFKVNSGEYKLMGLAPFGEPRFEALIERELIEIRNDGSFRLNMRYFHFHRGLSMFNSRFERLFGVAPRAFEGPMQQIYMDIAASIQAVLEKAMLRLAENIKAETKLPNLCLAGGVALNCVANGKISQSGLFDRIFIQPAAGDAGGALGAALAFWHLHLNQPRVIQQPDALSGSKLGPSFNSDEIRWALVQSGLSFKEYEEDDLMTEVARWLSEQKVVAWFQGRMEFGPRALGSRSILGDARNPEMKNKLNLQVKFREAFRPFAPIVLQEKMKEHFNLHEDSPYMLLVGDSIYQERLPAVTHVDGTARVQTVAAHTDRRLYLLLKAFDQLTGCPVLINTSLNVRGEPVVLSPEQAIDCFKNTHIDILVMGDFVVLRSNAKVEDNLRWRDQFELD